MNPDLISEIVMELIAPIKEKTIAIGHSHSPDVAINVLLNLGVQVIARGLSIINADERMMPFLGAIKAIVEEANLHSAHIDMSIALQDIMKKK